MLTVDLRIQRVVAGVDVEGGMGRMCVLIGKARVVMHERIAAVDADYAERPGWIGASALRKTDVIAG